MRYSAGNGGGTRASKSRAVQPEYTASDRSPPECEVAEQALGTGRPENVTRIQAQKMKPDHREDRVDVILPGHQK